MRMQDSGEPKEAATETPSPGGEEKSAMQGDSDAGGADGDGEAQGEEEDVEAEAARSGGGSDAEGGDKSDSEGGNDEEVNEEEALEKFIDEGGKLSDLDSGSEGGAHSLEFSVPGLPFVRTTPTQRAVNTGVHTANRSCLGNLVHPASSGRAMRNIGLMSARHLSVA